MKYTNNSEVTWGTILIALTITALAMFLLFSSSREYEIKPSPTSTPTPEPTQALVLRSALKPVCSCESIGNKYSDPYKYHYEDDGKTLLIGRVNPADRGMCQLNMDAHGSTIEAMGLDIFNDLHDYVTYANHLYDTQGLRPWRYSQHCWS